MSGNNTQSQLTVAWETCLRVLSCQYRHQQPRLFAGLREEDLFTSTPWTFGLSGV